MERGARRRNREWMTHGWARFYSWAIMADRAARRAHVASNAGGMWRDAQRALRHANRARANRDLLDSPRVGAQDRRALGLSDERHNWRGLSQRQRRHAG